MATVRGTGGWTQQRAVVPEQLGRGQSLTTAAGRRSGSVAPSVALSPDHPQQITEGFFPIEHTAVTDRADWLSLVPPADRTDAGLSAAEDARPLPLLQPHDGEVAHDGHPTARRRSAPRNPSLAAWLLGPAPPWQGRARCAHPTLRPRLRPPPARIYAQQTPGYTNYNSRSFLPGLK